MYLGLPGAFLQASLFNPLIKYIQKMHLDLPDAFLQVSLLNPYSKYIENAPGSSWCIPPSFLIIPYYKYVEMHLDLLDNSFKIPY